MSWEYNNTDCKYENWCPNAPRCIASSKKQCKHYRKDLRNFWSRVYEDGLSHTLFNDFRKK